MSKVPTIGGNYNAPAVNELVTHRHLDLGIGCIIKKLKVRWKVKFPSTTVNLKVSEFYPVNTSMCTNIPYSEMTARIMYSKGMNDCILGCHLMHFVGIGWIEVRGVCEADLKQYKRVTH